MSKQDVTETKDTKPGELDLDGFLLIACGHAAFQLLWAGAQLDLFSLLSKRGALTLPEIATALKLDLQPARVLLGGLTALRLLTRRDDRYQNSKIADQYLVQGSPDSAISYLEFQHHVVYKGLTDLTESLRENRNVGLRHFPGDGNTLYQRLASDPALEKIFHDSMSRISQTADSALVESADLSGRTHLLDVGGGDGTNTIRLVQRHPGLRATLFDLPSVCQTAQRKIDAAGLSQRIKTVPGNFLTDELPSGADCILVAHILTIWSPQRNTELLKKCFRALPPGGKLFTLNMISRDDETGPLINALSSAYFQGIATGEGMLYSGKDYRDWFRQAGFADVSMIPLPWHHGLFVVVKGK